MDSITAIAPLLGIGTAGAGIAGNIMNSITRGQQTSKLQSAEKQLANLTPQQYGSMVAGATQPLNQNLLNLVGNQVQADVASRGLAESPGTFAATESQALAPFQQQNQNTALQLILTKLGLPIEYANAVINSVGPNANVGGILQALMQLPGAGGTRGAFPGTSASAGTTSPVPDILQSLMNVNASTPSFPGLTPTDTTGSFGGLE